MADSMSKRAYTQVANVLRTTRIAKNMTQEDLAAASGVSAAYIGFIEQGLKKPTIETICKLVEALDITLEKHIFKGL
jgi:transcriptional regulator with XRE-family HTH domain